MNERTQKLIEKYKVSDEDTNAIFQRVFIPSLKNIIPPKDPVAVIIGAQPGAGKSQLLNRAKKDFKDNIVVCNADEYRTLHPDTSEIFKLHEKHFTDITVGFAQKLNVMLMEECKKRKINFALEITMRDGSAANKTLHELKSIGYTCNVDLVAVNDKWSRLGTIERLESQRATERFGRIVSTEAHDERYNAMPKAVNEIMNKHIYDNIRIFGRGLVSINDKIEQQVVLVAKNPSNPLEILVKERDRPFTSDETKHFKNEVERVALMMKMRNATDFDIAVFKRNSLDDNGNSEKRRLGLK